MDICRRRILIPDRLRPGSMTAQPTDRLQGRNRENYVAEIKVDVN